jgi:peptidyl-prolyl cis-trans isomerase C
MMTASARHLLVDTKEKCEEIKQEILAGKTTFEEAALKHSTCPSGKSGGELGTFGQGQMVPEFDKVVFNDEIGVIHGPVQTQFGYHLLEVTDRRTMPTASARHILVDSEEKCNELKNAIANGETTFEEAAKANSTCPSGQSGGDLGNFGQGQMVPEFDQVVFNDEVGVVHGPVKTQFGYHLLEITERND